MRLFDGTQVGANEWFVFGRCVKYVEKNPAAHRYGFYAFHVFPGRSGADKTARGLFARLVDAGLLSCNGFSTFTDTAFFISDKGWEAWRTK